MSENIILTVDITIPNGPKIYFNRTLTVEAYDKINVTIPPGAINQVELQPSDSAGQVQFLQITSDFYGQEISYKIGPNATDKSVELDEPHLLTGKGAVSILDPAPKKLFFTNSTSGPTAKDVTIQILVGRNALQEIPQT